MLILNEFTFNIIVKILIISDEIKFTFFLIDVDYIRIRLFYLFLIKLF